MTPNDLNSKRIAFNFFYLLYIEKDRILQSIQELLLLFFLQFQREFALDLRYHVKPSLSL